jgi:phosphoglucomutase
MALLAAEITAKTGKDPGEHYDALTQRFGAPVYRRVDSPITPEKKERLLSLTDLPIETLAGEPVQKVLTKAPANDAAIGGVKVVAEHGWFAARPSGTEDIYKLYAESLRGEEHLEQIIEEAREALG